MLWEFRDIAQKSSWYYTKIGKAWTNLCSITNYFVYYIVIPAAINFLSNIAGFWWNLKFSTESQWTRELLCGCGALTRILRKCPPTTWPWPWELFGGWVQYTVGSNLAEIRHGWQKLANYQLQYAALYRTAWHWPDSDPTLHNVRIGGSHSLCFI